MASTAAHIEDRNVSIGRVFSRAFSTVGSNPITMFGIAFLFGAVPNLAVTYAQHRLRVPFELQFGVPAAIILWLASLLLAVLFGVLTQGALVRATIAHSEGRRASIGESITAGLSAIVPLFLLGLFIGLGLTLGFILLIIPSLFLYVLWSVAAPALVEERQGVFAALESSGFLTKGARWKVLGLELVVLLIVWGAAIALVMITFAIYGLQGFAAASREGMPLWYMVGAGVIQTLSAAIWGAIQTSLYVELRNWKDGPAPESLAAIFG